MFAPNAFPTQMEEVTSPWRWAGYQETGVIAGKIAKMEIRWNRSVPDAQTSRR